MGGVGGVVVLHGGVRREVEAARALKGLEELHKVALGALVALVAGAAEGGEAAVGGALRLGAEGAADARVEHRELREAPREALRHPQLHAHAGGDDLEVLVERLHAERLAPELHGGAPAPLGVGAPVVGDGEQERVAGLERRRGAAQPGPERLALGGVHGLVVPAGVGEGGGALKPELPRGVGGGPLEGVGRGGRQAPVEALVEAVGPEDGDVGGADAHGLERHLEGVDVGEVALLVLLGAAAAGDERHLEGEPHGEGE